MDFSKIFKVNKDGRKCKTLTKDDVGQRETSSDFVDDPEVPPLE
jgi:hypothetical protein